MKFSLKSSSSDCITKVSCGELWELHDVSWDATCMLNFVDSRVEEVYWHHVSRRGRTAFLRLAIIWAVLSFGIDFLGRGMYVHMSSTDSAALAVAWAKFLNSTLIAVLGVTASLRPSSFEVCGCLSMLAIPVLICISHPYRASKIFDTNFYWDRVAECNCTAEACTGDAGVILTLLIVCQLPLFAHIRLTRAFWVAPYTAIVYSAMSYSVGPHSSSDTVTTTLAFSVAACCVVIGLYRVEDECRQRWLEAVHLRIDAETQKQRLLQHEEWVQELRDRLRAAEQPDVNLDDVPLVSVALCGKIGGVEQVWKATVPSIEPPCTIPPGPDGCSEEPNALLVSAMEGKDMDSERLEVMARRIGDEDYDLQTFFGDAVATFPELSLFFAQPAEELSSGSSAATEFQRTVGALFGVYWLLRLDVDGKSGFCFGYDDDWVPHRAEEVIGVVDHEQFRSRRQFYEDMEWACMGKVSASALAGSPERLKAMLCLTAFHDIMKVESLCPTVSPAHAPYHGYSAGETISDHDVALAYVLDKYPDLLPSYRGLSKESRAVILFTQHKLKFNHGWFVQAEAPPGHMLSHFKSMLDHAEPADLAFYFLHWLTDLSGAEGRPLAGAEKFVLRFPRSVLSNFMWSIPFLQKLAEESKTETEVMQQYLEARFLMWSPQEKMPQGSDAIAILRLCVMAQVGEELVQPAYWELPAKARRILSVELARTGIDDQVYSMRGEPPPPGGPALFVYYGPAMLQHCGTSAEMLRALLMLAAIYRAGRSLWPLCKEDANLTVQLQAGCLKTCAGQLAPAGDVGSMGALFVLERLNRSEARVSVASGRDMNELMQNGKCNYVQALEMQEDTLDDEIPTPKALQSKSVWRPSTLALAVHNSSPVRL